MNTSLKSAKIAAAVALALGAATLTSPSQAVNLSDNALGSVAIVPMYSTRGTDTYISIVNTSPTDAIALKIRFREADNSRDARDFNIVLSPNDVWVGVVTVNAAGIPLVQTADTSCTAPALLASDATNPGMKGKVFTTADYDGSTSLGQDAKAAADIGIDRTTDGHFEIIEMGSSVPGPDTAEGRNIAGYASHGSGYFDCSVVAEAMTYTTEPARGMDYPATEQFYPPIESMKVATTLLGVSTGLASMVPITTLQGFDTADQNIIYDPGSTDPNLNNANPAHATQIVNGAVTETDFTHGVDAVSSLIMATEIINEYAVGGAAAALNDWVVTFPTKNFYVDGMLMLQQGVANNTETSTLKISVGRPPFSKVFVGTASDGLIPSSPVPQMNDGNGACERVAFIYYDRDEVGHVGDGFSPTPVGKDVLCFETQTLQFGATPILNGRNNSRVILAAGFTSGWMDMTFISPVAAVTGLPAPYYTPANDVVSAQLGLPVISFGVKELTNGVIGPNVLNYGFTQEAAYRRAVAD